MKYLHFWVACLVAMLTWGHAQAQQLADTSAGAKRAAVCFACHGEDGVSRNPSYPHLRNQQRAYLEKQLKDFRDGRRVDPAMTAMAKPLSDEDIRNIAAYYWGVTLAKR